jgi:hypothetical protein
VLLHPATVYVITDVPADTPLTSPLASIVATEGVALDQVPPAGLPDNVVVDPAVTLVNPEMIGPTVISPEALLVVVHDEAPLVTTQ